MTNNVAITAATPRMQQCLLRPIPGAIGRSPDQGRERSPWKVAGLCLSALTETVVLLGSALLIATSVLVIILPIAAQYGTNEALALTMRIEPEPPIAHHLQGDATSCGRLCAAASVIDHRQCQQPPNLVRIFAFTGN